MVGIFMKLMLRVIFVFRAAASYDVEVDDTAAAIHCELHGLYRLLLSQHHITLTDPDTSNPVITWMYR